MAVGLEQIGPAIEVVVEKQHPEGQRPARRRADASDDGLIVEQRDLAAADVQGGHLVREVADRDGEPGVVAVVRAIDSHGAACVPVRVIRDAALDADLLEHAAAVDEEEVARRIVDMPEAHVVHAVCRPRAVVVDVDCP